MSENRILPFLPVFNFNPDHLAEPRLCLVNHSRVGWRWVTAVTRVFEPEVGYCGRCPLSQCSVTDGVCLVTVQELIPSEDAADLETHSRRHIDPHSGEALHEPAR